VFLIMFKTRHALPLPGGRFSCPRIGRCGGAERLRNMYRSWPQTRHGHGQELVKCRTRTQTGRVRKQSVSASCPRQQSRSQTVRIHELAMASIVHEHASAAVADCPQTVRSHELSAPANSPQTRIVHELQLARNCSRHGRVPSRSVPASFQVYIQIIPNYDDV
jgi:hypothetical protein